MIVVVPARSSIEGKSARNLFQKTDERCTSSEVVKVKEEVRGTCSGRHSKEGECMLAPLVVEGLLCDHEMVAADLEEVMTLAGLLKIALTAGMKSVFSWSNLPVAQALEIADLSCSKNIGR